LLGERIKNELPEQKSWVSGTEEKFVIPSEARNLLPERILDGNRQLRWIT